MADIEIYPLSEKPEHSQTCAAWSYGQWTCYFHNIDLEDSIKNYEERKKNIDELPLIWVAEVDGKIAGMIGLKEEDGHPESMSHLKPWLTGVFVHPLFRKQGVASRLIETLLIKAKELKFKEIFLTTPDAEKLYKKHGFSVIDTIDDSRGYTDKEQLMRKSL